MRALWRSGWDTLDIASFLTEHCEFYGLSERDTFGKVNTRVTEADVYNSLGYAGGRKCGTRLKHIAT